VSVYQEEIPMQGRFLRKFLGVLTLTTCMVASGGVLATPVAGGILNWVGTPEPSSLVPLVTTAGGNCDIGPKVVEGLLTYDDQLNPKPLLATDWSVSKDGLQYRFALRKGVKWHDGKPFTSADVAFSILTLRQYHPRGKATFQNVTEVRTPDPYTAIIVLSQPAPYLLTALASTESPIVPKHLYEGTDIVNNKYSSAPVGTGPFIFKQWVRGSYVELVRNPDYWDKPKPYLDKIFVRFIPDPAARALAFETGAADLGLQAIPLSDVERFKSLPAFGIDTKSSPYLGTQQQLYFNFDNAILQKREVRHALAQALDLQAFNKVVWYGYGQVSPAAIGPLIAKYHDATQKYLPFNPLQAEKELDAAGYPRSADGTRFKLRLLIDPWVARQAADFVRQSLIKVGVGVTVETYDFATFTTKTYNERAFDLVLEGLSNMFDPVVGVQRIFWSKAIKPGIPFVNPAHYVNPAVDHLLEEAAVEIDQDKRRSLYLEFQRLAANDVASIELGASPQVTIYSRKVKNYAPTAEGLRGSFAELYIEK
jgi:peptide/nickel transport system substrate-binding protein